MRELVTSKMTKVLSHCLILRPCNNRLNVIRIAVLEDILFHEISVLFDFSNETVLCILIDHIPVISNKLCRLEIIINPVDVRIGIIHRIKNKNLVRKNHRLSVVHTIGTLSRIQVSVINQFSLI